VTSADCTSIARPTNQHHADNKTQVAFRFITMNLSPQTNGDSTTRTMIEGAKSCRQRQNQGNVKSCLLL
jgi:hypothetical protein